MSEIAETQDPGMIDLVKPTGDGRKRRERAERRFKFYGRAAVVFAIACLAVLLVNLAGRGIGALTQYELRLEVDLDAAKIDPAQPGAADYRGLVKNALRDLFPDVRKRRDKKSLYKLVSTGAGFEVRQRVLAQPQLIGRKISIWLPVSDEVDTYLKSDGEIDSRLNGTQTGLIAKMRDEGMLELTFNTRLFTNGDSREPELAGILGATVGSFLTLLVCFFVSFPVAVGSAVYLEEFAPKNRITDFIEVNINNLAAVPSIIFGLLGLALFLNVFGLPRSAPIAGGLVLALMTLPTIIIATRAALSAVPLSIREAALGLGASPIQSVLHHVLPLAMPGILTGSIIGMSRALGETAPLLLIGMVAFIVDIPTGFTDPATALPVQIFLWADSPERAFSERTAAAIIVLLTFLILMNLTAVLLRRKFERRW